MKEETSKASTTDPHPVPLQAGRKLDGIIAERVFGLRYETEIESGPWGWYRGENWVCDFYDLPEYSTEIGSAWEVVEKVDNRNAVAKEIGVRVFTLNLYDDGSYSASFFNAAAHAETAPLAICLASLRAIGEVSS